MTIDAHGEARAELDPPKIERHRGDAEDDRQDPDGDLCRLLFALNYPSLTSTFKSSLTSHQFPVVLGHLQYDDATAEPVQRRATPIIKFILISILDLTPQAHHSMRFVRGS